MTRSNSSRCPEGQLNPFAAAASAELGSGPVSSEPVARPLRAAGNSALVDSCPTKVVLFAALGTLLPPLTQT